MRNSFGNNISVTLFGESHGQMIGATLDGIPAGIKLDREHITKKLAQRKPYGKISTSRHEDDEPMIISGVFDGFTTGTPITVLIENKNTNSKDYSLLKDCPRPSHADYTAFIKYGEHRDYRGGGHFSGRLTAPLVSVGAILESILADKDIYIGTHIKNLAGIQDRDFSNFSEDISSLSQALFPVLSDESSTLMVSRIEEAASCGDSVGGILETAVIGLPAGVGEPWFDTLEGQLAHILFSVPAVKGVEFGLGFGFAEVTGSAANDEFRIENEKIFTTTNNNGVINGGISNGMPLVFKTAIKPTPSIFKEQNTVNLKTMENTTVNIHGRHDPAIIHRARPVIDAVTAIAVTDMLAAKYGTDWLK